MNIFKKILPQGMYYKWLRMKGMQIGKDVEIYKSATFGSEPWLIKIGDHVRINEGVRLITHDGGYWVLRNQLAGFETEFVNADYLAEIVIAFL